MTLNSPSAIAHRHWLLFVSVLLLSLNSVFAADEVTRRSDRVKFRGELTAMTNASITIKQSNGQSQEIPVSDIYGIRYDMEPPVLNQAQSNERSGSLDAALEKYLSVQKDYAGDDKRLVVDLKFLIARTLVKTALADPTKVDAASKAIKTFRTENKTNFRYLEATLLEAQLMSLSSAGTATAQELLKEVQASSVTGFQLQAGVLLGRLLLAANDASGALAAFDDVIAKSGSDPGAVAALFDGMLGKALCQQKQNQIDDAIATLDQVIAKASESESQTLAEAWVLKGDCLRSKTLPKDALMAYLHVDVLYASEPAAHAEALYHLTTLWAPAGHQDRADEAKEMLMTRYPNSSWAKKASGAAP